MLKICVGGLSPVSKLLVQSGLCPRPLGNATGVWEFVVCAQGGNNGQVHVFQATKSGRLDIEGQFEYDCVVEFEGFPG